MERIRNLTEYLGSDKKRLAKVAEEEVPFPDPILVKRADNNDNKKTALETAGLTKQQIAVNKKFPMPHDAINACHEKFSILTSDWRPSSEIWTLNNSFAMICCANLLTTNWLVFTLRAGYGLSGTYGLLNTFLPPVFVSLLMGTATHRYFVTLKMFRGIDECEVCDALKSAAIQFSTAFVGPLVVGSLTSTYMAWYFNTYAMHDNFFKTKESRRYIYNKIWHTIKRNRKVYLALGVANCVFGYYLADAEREDMLFMYLKLLEREYRNTQNLE